jgi:hypothetical protein
VIDPQGGPTSSSTRAPATAPASAASRTIRRWAWRCAPAIRCISSSSSAIRSRARPCSTSACRAAVRAQGARTASATAQAGDGRQLPGRLGGHDAGGVGPDDTGPIVINGAPMSYWGGALERRRRRQPDALCGRMLGGTWLASLTADLGNGKFDGATWCRTSRT